MARSDVERYDQTMRYLTAFDAELAQHLDQQVSQISMPSKPELGKLLSLKGIWSRGHLYRSQHDAMRALLLCQAVYLQPPWARKLVQEYRLEELPDGPRRVRIGEHYDPFYMEWQMKVPTSIVRNLSRSQIDERLRAYCTLPTPSKDDLAKAARCLDGVTRAPLDFRDLSRVMPCRFQHAICYDAVKQFLFRAGFISIRWLANQGPSLESHTANRLLGDGREATVDDLRNVEPGWIFNFHGGTVKGRNNQDVCHWGVTLGGGLGAGTNTTQASGTKRVTCRGGSLDPGCWGMFNLVESYEVCQHKYGADRGCATVIRLLDPTSIPELY